MFKQYDYLFVTHLPAFYKVNLYNELAKKCKVCVIFVAPSSEIRARDFTPKNFTFDYHVLNSVPFEKRHWVASIRRLRHLIKSLHYQKLVVGGWDLIEFWWLVFFLPRDKNCLALESTILESHNEGWRSLIKKIFLLRVSLIFFSGKPHQALLHKLHYVGEMRETCGVGIFNYQPKIASLYPQGAPSFQGKFLYVGRLAPEKNLEFLIQVFAQLPDFSLTLVGQGPLLENLRKKSPPNVIILGHVPNTELGALYQQHDVFILPSLREPWGLVVEEALYYGLPVLASTQVGCAQNLIVDQHTGILFDPHQFSSLQDAIRQIAEQYVTFVNNVAAVNFKARDQKQIQQYVEALL